MPVWSSIYDSQLKRIVEKYQWGDTDFECSSSLFESMTVSESPDNTLSLKYENMLEDMTINTSSVSISCTGWRNWLVPDVTPGYYIRTFSFSHSLIDQTEEFSFDSTGL